MGAAAIKEKKEKPIKYTFRPKQKFQMIQEPMLQLNRVSRQKKE